jgi:signal peptidase I
MDEINNENNNEKVTTVSKKEKKQFDVKSIIKDVIPFIVAIIAILLIKKYIVTPIQVNGNSMDSTLKDGDIMILNKISYKIHGIKRFDIVVIDTDDTLLVKRVIGLPNEKIKVKDNILYINDKKVEQDFLGKNTTTSDFEYVTKDDCYFVMGDNRDISLDSRDLGCFDIDKIEGTTKFTIYPFNRFGNK